MLLYGVRACFLALGVLPLLTANCQAHTVLRFAEAATEALPPGAQNYTHHPIRSNLFFEAKGP